MIKQVDRDVPTVTVLMCLLHSPAPGFPNMRSYIS